MTLAHAAFLMGFMVTQEHELVAQAIEYLLVEFPGYKTMTATCMNWLHKPLNISWIVHKINK
jgi:hypothetical protein